MNGLTGARVIIVDDDEQDALPMLSALSRKGIPATYFDGTQRGLPSKNQRLSGVRLAILDMNLVGGRVPDKSKMSALMNSIKGILDPENGPYGVIIWTGNAYLIPEFENAIFADADIPKPIFAIPLDKQECKVNDEFDIDIISKKIDDFLAQFSPLLLLQAWEEKCFIAATEVTNELAALVTQNAPSLNDWRDQWKIRLLQLMRAMAVAEAGQQLNGGSVLNSLFGSMNPLHADRMESNITSLRKSLSRHSDEIMTAAQAVDIRTRAKLNTMFHLAVGGVSSFYAGNIYIKSRLPSSIPTVKRLLDDLAGGNNDNNKKQNKTELTPVSKSVVIEINATCDHAQNNVRIARFIAGLLVPENKSGKIKKADYIYKLGPMFLKSSGIQAGEYYFYFSARHLLTIELRQATKATAFARLRGQALADLQAWFAHRAARPGMLSL